jgi:hypothetical protein
LTAVGVVAGFCRDGLNDQHETWHRLRAVRRSATTAPQKTTRPLAMLNPIKMRQAGMIVFATTLILILPNLTRLVS